MSSVAKTKLGYGISEHMRTNARQFVQSHQDFFVNLLKYTKKCIQKVLISWMAMALIPLSFQ